MALFGNVSFPSHLPVSSVAESVSLGVQADLDSVFEGPSFLFGLGLDQSSECLESILAQVFCAHPLLRRSLMWALVLDVLIITCPDLMWAIVLGVDELVFGQTTEAK